MTTFDNHAAAVAPMTVTVKVLVVDGTRRMSHKFYEQIPHRDVIDKDTDQVLDGAELWGQVRLPRRVDREHVEIVWALDGRLYKARYEWWSSYPEYDTAVRLRDELPQLFVGG